MEDCLILEKFILGPLQTNTYFYQEPGGICLLFDPAFSSKELDIILAKNKLSAIFLTHGHIDHFMGLSHYKDLTNAPILIHKNDAECLINPRKNLSAYFLQNFSHKAADIILNDNQLYLFQSGYEIKAIYTPGHTPGSISYYDSKNSILFSGDFIFDQNIGRTDFPGGDIFEMQKSLQTIIQLPDSTHVFPGHGDSFFLGDFKPTAKSIIEEITNAGNE